MPPDTDPQELIEDPFEQEGYLYSFADIVKEENLLSDTLYHRETVTVETASNDLSKILEQLEPSIDYDDGTYKGVLALDHTSIHTEASGYETRSSTVTATKTIGPVDRNDMSYVPATTVKNGVTLNLSGVDWQVTGTDLVGDTLSPSSYQAVATYSGKSYYKAATGYVTTAEYKGEVVAEGVDSITYTVVYVGTEIVPEEPEPVQQDGPAFVLPWGIIGGVLLAIALAALAGGGVFLFLRRKNVYIYVPGDKPRDYKLIAKFRVEASQPEVDIQNVEPYPDGVVAVEIKRPLAKKLVGQPFTVRHRTADHTYAVLRDRPADWHEFDLTKEKEEPI